jgi:hypothetical protein
VGVAVVRVIDHNRVIGTDHEQAAGVGTPQYVRDENLVGWAGHHGAL